MKICCIIILPFLLAINLFCYGGITDPVIIPKPAKLIPGLGKFNLNEKTIIVASGKDAENSTLSLNDYLFNYFGIKLKTENASSQKTNFILLKTISAPNQGNEAYRMDVNKNFIAISGGAAGVFYGVQTLKQLLTAPSGKEFNIPCMHIEDYPRYTWRGMHLDVSRHFFSKEVIEKYIDYLAFYKMNTFHWHLTDDQGWRIEIKKYPKLTQKGAVRNGTLIGHSSETPEIFDTISYGGFYTQDDVKEIVAYAAKRYITIVPEIELPGHAMAALAAYPEYSCTGGPFEVINKWGVFDDVFCPREETFKFLEDVLSEIMELFPGKYIHIGGDECPKARWKKCEHCQDLMKKEKLKNENELQSYFIKRMETFINSKGKTLIGWDEILEGGLAPNAAVMSWRGAEGGIAAAKLKHFVVMTPGAYCYFDHYQGSPKNEPLAIGGYITVEKVYSYEPTPKELKKPFQKYVLGAQGNVWTEYIATPEQLEYMVFPRICALSEVLWSPKKLRNYTDFKWRLISHFKTLDMMKVNYSKAIFETKFLVSSAKSDSCVEISLSNDIENSSIYYTLDGSEPTVSSNKYQNPVNISSESLMKFVAFKNNQQIGKTCEQKFWITKSSGKKITLLNEPSKSYNTGGSLTLVDGIVGRSPWYGKEWLGFLGEDCNATIDLGTKQNISKITVDVLSAEWSWIYLPKSIEILVSDDGINFTSVKKSDSPEIEKQKRAIAFNFENLKTRYIKVIAVNYGKIPAGKPGEGEKAWLFMDEIMIE